MTINDMLEQGVTIQGRVIVYAFDGDNDFIMFDGDGDELPSPYDDVPWANWELQYIYPSSTDCGTTDRVTFIVRKED